CSSDLLTVTVESTGENFSGSAWHFGIDQLDYVPAEQGSNSASGLVPLTSRHGADIKIQDFVRLNMDFGQMGVGGDTSWGRPVHDEYTLDPENYNFGFIIIPQVTEKQ